VSELWRLSAREIAAGIRSGELSAVEVVEACQGRIAETEPRLSAFLDLLSGDARRRAEEIDRRRRAGEELGPLAGVPVALKDNIALAGTATSCGSQILKGYRSPYSATAVERLLAAGAVIVGKTNLDEFAMGSSCENSSFQKTRNPWHLGRVPGGSSGGSAAAVAARGVPLALGSDTGGSVRQPAALCGVVGLKPTWGRVSRYGLVAFASSLDQIGPLTCDVADSALALSVIAGHDSRDATSAAREVADDLAGLDDGLEGLSVGVVREVSNTPLDPAVERNWRESLEILRKLGAELREISIPTLGAAVAIYYVIATSEASANLARFDGARYGRRGEGAGSLEELYRRSRSEGFGAEVKRRIMLGTFALSSGYYDAYYGRAQGVRETLRREFSQAFDEVDVLVTPTTSGGAFALGERVDDPLAMYLADVYTTPASLVGIPAVSVPSGLDDEGLPLALQIMAPAFGESAALRVGRAFEREVAFELEPRFVESAAA